jgi:hypothetical protein
VTWLELSRGLFVELAAVALPLLGYFFCMLAVLTAAVGVQHFNIGKSASLSAPCS